MALEPQPPRDPIAEFVRRLPKHVKVSLSVVVAMLLISWFFFFQPSDSPSSPEDSEVVSATLEGRIVALLPEVSGQNDESGLAGQRVLVQITGGSERGREVEIVYEASPLAGGKGRLRPGDRVLIEYTTGPAGERFFVSDVVRLPSLLLLVTLFAIATIVVGQGVGLRALVSTGISVAAIVGFIIPGVLAGFNPLLVCITGSVLLMTATLYMTYQWGWKAHAALIGLTVSLVITGILATIFAGLARLTGLGTEEALFLIQSMRTPIDLRGLLLGSVLLGAVGALDDVAVGQASATFELHQANPDLNWRQLFWHSMAIGRDHIASVVNTLLLAYVGASLPLFLLLALQNLPLNQMLNREFFAEEVLRTLLGSLGLILAVPITSLVASLAVHRENATTTSPMP
jgi:uncharacterized membrane protein